VRSVEPETLKVSTKSNPNSVAGAMAGVIRQTGSVSVQVVGAGALNQAVKAVAIARGYLETAGLDLVCVPTFADIEIDGERRTALRLAIDDRERRRAADRPVDHNGLGATEAAELDLREFEPAPIPGPSVIG